MNIQQDIALQDQDITLQDQEDNKMRHLHNRETISFIPDKGISVKDQKAGGSYTGGLRHEQHQRGCWDCATMLLKSSTWAGVRPSKINVPASALAFTDAPGGRRGAGAAAGASRGRVAPAV